jgi:two-component system, response regulator
VVPCTMRRLLLVDDTKTDEKLALLAIHASGIPVATTVARDGQEAIDHLLGSASIPPMELPDLVLLDLNLPKVSGLDVLRRVRADARTRHVPIVMFTSAADPVDVLRSSELGANGFVSKPTGFDELVGALKTMMAFWMTLHIRA